MHPGSADAPYPERLGRYEVLLPIASGGMATVFLARSVGMAGFEREVAIKLTHSHLREKPSFFTSLIDEARLAGRIRHPNVVSVLDVGEDTSGVFIVMEYVEGDSLAGIERTLRRRNERMPFDVVLRILDDVLAGLHAAHELSDDRGAPVNLVHRDVTPHNVLVGRDGVTRLTDFGIAKAASRLTKTATGLVKGKLTYMSPEQARGMDIDRTCDIWAAGVVAWELFSGMRLYEGMHDAALLLKIVRESPTPLRHVRPEVPRSIADVVAAALTLDPRSRFRSAEAFALALGEAARVAGIPVADSRRVRAFVEPLVSAALGARRQKVSLTLEDRGRLDRPSSPELAAIPTSSIEQARAAETVMLQRTPASTPAYDLGATESVEVRDALTAAHGFEMPVSESRQRAAVDPSAILTAPLRSRLWLLAALIPAVVLLLIWAVSGRAQHDDEASAAQPIASVPTAPSPTASPSAAGDADTAVPVVTPSELELEANRPRTTRRPAPRKPAPAAPAKVDLEQPSQPAPLENPYKKR